MISEFCAASWKTAMLGRRLLSRDRERGGLHSLQPGVRATGTTKRQYTGQVSEMASIGLYFYGARFYDPVLSRFTSADSIVPGAGEVQAWDRYASMANNPVKYIDPTGHMQACPDGDEGGGCGSSGNIPDKEKLEIIHDRRGGREGRARPNALRAIDDWLWESVPSAIGINIGVSGQLGAVVEPGIVPGELTALFNWRSGELSVLQSYEAFMYFGTPSVFGGNLYGGWTEVYGASNNDYLQGPSAFGGLTASGDAIAKFGMNAIGGRAIKSGDQIPPQWFMDPKSKRPIEYHQIDMSFGGNLGSNGIDFGGFGGGAYTRILWTYAFPQWPLR